MRDECTFIYLHILHMNLTKQNLHINYVSFVSWLYGPYCIVIYVDNMALRIHLHWVKWRII
jgi:hypothetical protein